MNARVARRGRDVSDATLDVVERQDRIAVGEISWRRFDSRREAATLADRVRELATDAARSPAIPLDPTGSPREERGPHS